METEVAGGGSVRRRLWTADEKRRIVEQTLSSDSSVAMVARQHGVNANQVFYWRKLYRAGQLGKNEQPEGMRLLPVSVSDDEPSQSAAKQDPQTTSGVSINIEIPGRALVSVEGAVDSGQHADLAAGGDYRHARGLLGLHGCSVRRAAAYLKRSCRQK